jgi:hypothetical protein
VSRSSRPSFIGAIAAILAALIVGGGLSRIGVPIGVAIVGGVAFVAVVYIGWANFTSRSRPAVRQVMEQDVHRMSSTRITPSEIADRTGLERHQVRRILAGDDGWWKEP